MKDLDTASITGNNLFGDPQAQTLESGIGRIRDKVGYYQFQFTGQPPNRRTPSSI